MKSPNTASIYQVQQNILVAVDCIIFGFDGASLKLLLFKRKREPLSGSWSLIGDFVTDNLTASETANKVLFEATGVKDVYLEQLRSYSEIDRDPGQRVISIAHYSLTRINELVAEVVSQHDAEWFDINELPELILDHSQMVDDAIKALKERVRYQPIGYDLLPKLFTIPHLQVLYESIYGIPLDSRNFRKKMFSFDILIKTEQKDKTASKKGAFLYKFDKSKFDKLMSQGFNFEV